MIIINRDKAESLTRDRLRTEREPRMAELDSQFIRALESGLDTAHITASKQSLRDVTEKSLNDLSLEKLAVITLDEALAL